MTDRPKIYLAGPDVFLPNAIETGGRKKAVCAAHGLEGLFPLDLPLDPPEGAGGPEIAALIYQNCLTSMRAADAVIANAAPFRGPGVDDGTAFELGWMAAAGKPLAAYENAGGDYAAKVARIAEAARTGDAWTPYTEIEAFGLPANLMLAVSAAQSVGFVSGAEALPADDLSRFEEAVRRMAKALGV